LGNWHRGGERDDRAVLEREKGRPITNAKSKKPERTAANPIRIPSKNPPNCLPHLQEQEQPESILVGKKIG
jgi:serine/threonine-protein phosphatase PP1 catalytic subunit